jgi:hypothetical protein
LGIKREASRLRARLDHLFVLTDSEAQAAQVEASGYSIFRRGPHRGGGTGNVVYRFRDALLELAYPIDEPEIARLGEIGFAERWRWRENGYCPFGVVVQIERSSDAQLPFDTWEYAPSFLPDTHWTIGQASPREPLYMIAPFSPDHQPDPAEPEISFVSIVCPGIGKRSAVARFLDQTSVCRVTDGGETLMDVRLGPAGLAELDMRPDVPLVLRADGSQNVTDRPASGF